MLPHAYFCRTLLFLGVFCLLGPTLELFAQARGKPPELAQTEQLLNQARAAHQTLSEGLLSAEAIGTVRHSLFYPDREQPTITIDADIYVAYDYPKFSVRLSYATRKTEIEVPDEDPLNNDLQWVETALAEQTVVFDGTSVFSVESWRDGRMQGDVYFDFKRENVLRSTGFPISDPVRLWLKALDIEDRKLDESTTTELSGGGFLGSLERSTYRLKYYFFGNFGYDLRRVSSYRLEEDIPFRDCWLQWREQSGVRYVNRIVTRIEEQTPQGIVRRQLEVDYPSFQINPPLQPTAFDISSVPMPIGTTFRDHRANIDGKPKPLVYDGQRLVEQL